MDAVCKVGAGAIDAGEELLAVAEALQAPVMSKRNGDVSGGGPEDGFKELMGRCVREAVEVVRRYGRGG